MSFVKNYSYGLVLIVIVFISSIILIAVSSSDTKEYIQIEVGEGDTLWGFAEKYSEVAKMPTNKFIEWIEEENQIYNGLIYEGQTIVLPISQEEVPVDIALMEYK